MPKSPRSGDALVPGTHIDARPAPQGASQLSSARPRKHLAVVTCMDSRIDVFKMLGLDEGDAHVLRNAGGLITDDMVRSLALSQRKLGTRDIIVVQHTGCGLLGVTEEELASEIQHDTGAPPPFKFGAFTDLEANLRASVRKLRSTAMLPHRTSIRAFIFDVDTHQLRELDVSRELAAPSGEPALS